MTPAAAAAGAPQQAVWPDDRSGTPAADPPGAPPELALCATGHLQARGGGGRDDVPRRAGANAEHHHTSIEEISSKVLTTLGIQREMF